MLSQLVLTPPPDLFVSILMLGAGSYGAGRHLEGRRGLVGLVLAAGTVTVVAAIYDPSDVFFPVAFFCIAPWLVGRTLRNHTLLARELAEKAERAEHARAEEERRAIAAERSRIARELHDVLAHSLSVMVVQSGAARRIVDRDPQRAAQAAELVRQTGREALVELRHLFGPVRRGEGEALSGPPSISRVEELARRARAAGLSVRLQRRGRARGPAGRGRPDRVPARPGGAHEHAQARRQGPRLGRDQLRAERGRDLGRGRRRRRRRRAAIESGGHGLLGMRERVAMYGGVLQAGPRDDGGFAVRARLPTRPLVPA